MLTKLLLLVFIFSISMFFSTLYVNGDQYWYHNVYEYMQGKSLFESYLYYSNILSKIEFVHFILFYVGSNLGVDKSIYMSFFNVCLFFTGLSFLRKCGFSFVLAIVILLTNFYIFTLMFSSERLKFGMIFLFIFLSYESVQRKSILTFAILSMLAHAQLIIFYAVVLFENVVTEAKKVFVSFKISKLYFFMAPFVIVAGLILFIPISQKVLFYIVYYGDNMLLSFVKWFAFYTVVFLSSKNKTKVSVRFAVLLIPILTLGAERLLFFCLILFFMEYRYRTKLYLLFLYPIIIYFMVKSIFFLNNIYAYGDGY